MNTNQNTNMAFFKVTFQSRRPMVVQAENARQAHDLAVSMVRKAENRPTTFCLIGRVQPVTVTTKVNVREAKKFAKLVPID